MTHRIVIVGGGFGGIAAALTLSKSHLDDVSITLISNRSWLEYYGVLYRLIGGKNKEEACIPLSIILGKTKTNIVIDTIEKISADTKMVKGKKGEYSYDTLLLAPGSVAAYFNIPGMEEHSLIMNGSASAIAIRARVQECVEKMSHAQEDEKKILGRFIVIGAGPTGIEVASEILPLAQAYAQKKNIDAALISVDVIEAMDRLLPALEENASARVLARMKQLGINVHIKRAVASAERGAVTFKDGERAEAATILWTAGVKPHPLLTTIAGLEVDKRGRVVVDEQLRAKGHPNIFVLGDCAATPFAGLAQTAVEDGTFAAKVIAAMLNKKTLPVYAPVPTAYAIPVGPRWAAVKFGFIRAYGLAGYILRRAADIHVYMLILPWRFVPAAFFGKRMTSEKGGIES